MSKTTSLGCSVVAIGALLAPTWSSAKDPFGRPALAVPSGAAKLQIAFAEPDVWDGKRVPRAMQCPRLGGQNPASPAFKVVNVPDAAKSLVVYVANVRNHDNHGLMRISEGRAVSDWAVPAVASGVQADGLPKGVTLFDGGNQMGVAYSAPCPGATNSSYAVTVYALGDGDVVLGIGEKALGWAP